MIRSRKPPSQTWRTFLDNHVSQLASIDFFTVHTVWFEVLFVFIVLVHDRRRIVHFNVAAHPTADRAAIARSFSVRDCASIFASRSGSNLRTGVSQTGLSDEHQGSSQRSALSLATCLCRTRHRFDSQRMSGPSDRLEPRVTAPYLTFVPVLLPSLPAPSLFGERFARIATCTVNRQSRCFSRSRRPAPSLRTRCIKPDLNCSFVSTDRRGMASPADRDA